MTQTHLLLADAGVLLATLSALLAAAAWGVSTWGGARHDALTHFARGWVSLAVGLLAAALSVPATLRAEPFARAALVGLSNVAFLWNAGFMYGALRRVTNLGPYPVGTLGVWLTLYVVAGLGAGALTLGGATLEGVELASRYVIFGWCAGLYLNGSWIVLRGGGWRLVPEAMLGLGALGCAFGLLGFIAVLPQFQPGNGSGAGGLWLPLLALVAFMMFAMGLVLYVTRDRRARDLAAALALADERLRAATTAAQLDAAMGAIGDAAIQLDRDLCLQAWNPSFERLMASTGVTPQVGSPCRVMMSDDTRPIWESGWRDIVDGRPAHFRLVRHFGDTRHIIDVRAAPTVQAGQVTGGVAVLRDITELVDLEARFHHAQRSEAVGRLAHGVAHDFNNLLAALNLTADLAADETDPAAAWDDVRTISARGRELTRQLLDLARRRPETEIEQFDLRGRLAGLASVLRRLLGGEIALHVREIDAALQVRMGAGHFDQILLNLVVNARDAMPHGGTITISAASLASAAGPCVEVRVRDTGVGMSPEVLAQALEAYFTTKGDGIGTGLGLSTCRELAVQAGGELRLESQVGRGTTAIIRLPLAVSCDASPDHAPAPLPRAANAATATSGAKAIVADDDPLVLRSVDRLLQRQGYRTIPCVDGREALEALRAADDVALIVSDVLMPNLDGPSWVREARQAGCQASVLFVSGYDAERVDAETLKDLRATFLSKPFTTTELASAVESRRRLDASGTAVA